MQKDSNMVMVASFSAQVLFWIIELKLQRATNIFKYIIIFLIWFSLDFYKNFAQTQAWVGILRTYIYDLIASRTKVIWCIIK